MHEDLALSDERYATSLSLSHFFISKIEELVCVCVCISNYSELRSVSNKLSEIKK